MATKGILSEAIRMLDINNMELRKKLTESVGKDKDIILEQIARNNSMILDFKFRLKNK
jgi:hypothetical protein